MTTTNYATQIVNNLESRGFNKDMIIGYLEGIIDGLKYLDLKQVQKYLQQTSKDSEK